MADSEFPKKQAQIIAHADFIEAAIDRAGEWSRRHLPQAQMAKFIQKNLMNRRATLRKVRDTLERPPALGVFGSSQCGKSYLVSELVKEGPALLKVLVNSGSGKAVPRDFLEELNPAGGRESTALVTRFTRKPYRQVGKCAVHVRLLGITDLIRIFQNGYVFDCQSDASPTADDLLKLRNSLRGIQPIPVPILTEEDVFDLKDYVKRHFRNPFFRMLDEIGYWNFLAVEARLLPFDHLLTVLQWLWGRFPKLTDLFRLLYLALGDLGDRVIGLSEDAILPREKSILDVQRLFALGQPGNRTCGITRPDGFEAKMDTSVLCALTRELILQVADDSHEGLLKNMDLLDFPGARSREPAFDNNRLTSDRMALSEVFLRGKVAYLFDRSSDDLDVTALVVCQDELKRVMARRFALGFLLDRDRFAISEKTIANLWDGVVNGVSFTKSEPDREDESSSKAGQTPPPPAIDEDVFAIEGITLETPESSTSTPENAPIESSGRFRRGDTFARAVFEVWEDQLVRLGADADFQRLTGLNGEWFAEVTMELVKGAFQMKIYDRIAEEADRALHSPNPMKFMRLQAGLPAHLVPRSLKRWVARSLNRFTSFLGSLFK